MARESSQTAVQCTGRAHCDRRDAAGGRDRRGRIRYYQARVFPVTSGAPPPTWLYNCGGSIGFCLPVATGAAMAHPDRKVVTLTGDGSAMYTLQSLWTIAREKLDVTVLVFANRSYKILP